MRWNPRVDETEEKGRKEMEDELKTP